MTSQELFVRSQKVAPGGVHSPVRAFKGVGGDPLFFRAAEGAYLISVEGDAYIDFCQSFGPNLLGHRDPEVAREVEEAVHTAWSFGACDPYSLELAEWIVSRVKLCEKVRFVCSGTEAVMSALRVARAATGRSRILKFEGCYHGHADALLVKAGSGLAGAAASDSAGVSPLVAGETLVAPLDNEEALRNVFAAHGGEIAAVILEPLPANFGLLPQRTEFIGEIMRLAREHGALVIFDEVISGFRVAQGGMAEVLRLRPDLVTYGKVIGGGFPIGAYGGRADLMDLVAPAGPVYQAGTLAANPVGVRAGLATLKAAEKRDIYNVLKTRTDFFVELLREGFAAAKVPLQVVQQASLFWLHPVTEHEVRSPAGFHPESREIYRRLFHGCLKRHVYLAPSAFEVGFVSAAHTEAILATAAEAIVESAREAYAGSV